MRDSIDSLDSSMYIYSDPGAIVFRAISNDGETKRQIEIRAKNNGDFAVDYDMGAGWHGEKIIAHW